MRKVLNAVLGVASIVAFAQPAFARSACEAQRALCYSEAGRANKADKNCDAEFAYCVGANTSARATPTVPTVPGLGAPMVQPYPTAAVPVNPGSGVKVHSANARAVGNLVIISPPSAPPSTSPGSSSGGGSSSQGGSSNQGGSSSGGGGSSGSSGSSTHVRAN
jgi:uncharacterized membrane protein YgcG